MNDLFNLKENKTVQNFIKELSNYLENNLMNGKKNPKTDSTWNNLLSDNQELDNKKIISKYKDKMLLERVNILQSYALRTREKGEMYYIYNTNTQEKDTYNLCICDENKSNEIITKKVEELPKGAYLGSVLRKRGENLVLDQEATENLEKEISNMIKKTIKEQDQYLESRRIEGHIYQVNEKDLGRIWLCDLNERVGGGIEEIEEIEFPKDLYEAAKTGDLFIYQDGTYQKY